MEFALEVIFRRDQFGFADQFAKVTRRVLGLKGLHRCDGRVGRTRSRSAYMDAFAGA